MGIGKFARRHPWFHCLGHIFRFFVSWDTRFCSNKEVISHATSQHDRYDGVFRYNDQLLSLDLGIHESSKAPPNVNRDNKGKQDFIKMGQGLCGMLKALAKEVGYDWAFVSRLQVVGFLTSGLNITCYRMSFLSANTLLLAPTTPRRVKIDPQSFPQVFMLMKEIVQHRVILENTISVVNEFRG